MRRTLLAIVALLVVAGCTRTAGAVWVESKYHEIRRGYHRNVAWPWPYFCPDRVAVREPFRMMVNNGWRRQNLLGPHHFNDNATELTTAGELRVHWIMTQAPAERRSIFIERAQESHVTAQRIEAVRQYAAHVAVDGQEPQVADTHLVSEGRPAAVVDATNVRFQESLPPPVLPAATVGLSTGQ
jgi:hypothetical protein